MAVTDQAGGNTAILTMVDVEHSHRKAGIAQIVEIVLQCGLHHGKGYLIPRYFGFCEHRHFQRLGSGSEVQVCQFGTEKHIHLVDFGKIEQRVEAIALNRDYCTGFFCSFSNGTDKTGLTIFHITGW